MPTWMRKFHLQKIKQFLDDKYEAEKEQINNTKSSPSQVSRPNIKPSSTYNFKK